MILAEKDSSVVRIGEKIISMCSFRFFSPSKMYRHLHTPPKQIFVCIKMCANFHANTHTVFPSLTPNNCVVTRQMYSITATDPLTPPFFLLHLSFLFILPLTSIHLAHNQEHFWGFSVVLAVIFCMLL